MRRVVVNMQNNLFADAITNTLRGAASDFDVFKAARPGDVVELCRTTLPYALMLEVTARKPWDVESRIRLRNEVKGQNPSCKITLLVDENAEQDIAEHVLRAKKDGLIDQFFYGSISGAYLAALMDTL